MTNIRQSRVLVGVVCLVFVFFLGAKNATALVQREAQAQRKTESVTLGVIVSAAAGGAVKAGLWYGVECVLSEDIEFSCEGLSSRMCVGAAESVASLVLPFPDWVLDNVFFSHAVSEIKSYLVEKLKPVFTNPCNHIRNLDDLLTGSLYDYRNVIRSEIENALNPVTHGIVSQINPDFDANLPASTDFDETIRTSSMSVTYDGMEYSSLYRTWRMISPGKSNVEVVFNLGSVPSRSFMSLIHLTSYNEGSPGGGYSPIDVYVNGTCILDNYDVAQTHGDHDWHMDNWQIESYLKTGQNTIRIEFEDDPWATTHYWIRSISVQEGIALDNYEPNDTWLTAYNIGSITAPFSISNLSCGPDDDWFRFTTVQTGTSFDYVRIAFLQTQGDLDMQLYELINPALIQEVAGSSSDSTANEELIMLDGLSAGTYLIRVYGHNSATNPNYTITIDPPDDYVSHEGDDLSIYTTSWTDDHTDSGDRDGIPEGGEDDIELKIKLKNNSGSDITNVEATLTTSVEGVDITDKYNDYGTIPSNGKSWGGGRFLMDLNFNRYSSCPFTLHVTYKKNGSPYYQNIEFTKTFPADGELGPIFEIDHIVVKDTYEEDTSNNNDGILQSGESIGFDLYLKNAGNADAMDVEAKVTNVRGHDGTAFDVYHGWDSFPDISSGGGVEKQNGKDFQDIWVPANFKGTIFADITVRYGKSGIEQVLKDQVLFQVQPEAWLDVTPNDYDFGFVSTDKDVKKVVKIRNYGTKPLTIQSITPSHDDTTWIGDPLPWTLQPGESKTIEVKIETEDLDGEKITRQIVVIPDNGRIEDVGEDDRIIITGLVNDSIFVNSIPNTNGAEHPDISGDWIVYKDRRNDNSDIYAYQISSGKEFRITTDPAAQEQPFISGNLIVWEDKRNWDGETKTEYQGVDIYGYDLSTKQEFVVSADQMSEDLIGVDGDLVIFTRVYDILYDRNGNPDDAPLNLIVYKYLGNGKFSKVFDTGWTSKSGHEKRPSVSDGDFNGGMLILEKFEWEWKDNKYGGYWSMEDQHLVKIDFAMAENGFKRVEDNFYAPQAASNHRFVCIKDINGIDQVMLWENGTLRQITTDEERKFGGGALALGERFIVYDKRGLDGLFYYDLSTNKEGILIGTGYCEYARIDKNCVVWNHLQDKSRSIRYAFLGPDLYISAEDIKLSNEVIREGDIFDVTVTVKNISKWDITEDFSVRLYDGNPNEGGSLLGSPHAIIGGIPAKNQESIIFHGIKLPEGKYLIYAVCSIVEEEYSGNNIASKEIYILPPLKGDVDGNKKLDLTDAILALQVVSGMKPQGIRQDYPLSGTDVNGDDRIGIEEAIYIMQKVSGLR